MAEEALETESPASEESQFSSPTRILLRGLAVSLPAVLTVVIAIWVGNFVNVYIIHPATISVKFLIAKFVDESLPTSSPLLGQIEGAPPINHTGSSYRVTRELFESYTRYMAGEKRSRDMKAARVSQDDQETSDAFDEQAIWNSQVEQRIAWMQLQAENVPAPVFVPLGPRAVPYDVYSVVARNMPPGQIPGSSDGVYMEYVAHRYFGSTFLLSALTVSLIVILLYFIGRFVSARVGAWIVRSFEEQFLGRLPIVRNVYGSVKQVTDFVFTEDQNISYRGVAAVQYPRKGIWTIGFVTGESVLEVAVEAQERCVAVLIPTSPMPMTGFTINVPATEIVELNLTVEQAMQFCISCGVLTPAHQKLKPESLRKLVASGKILESTANRLLDIAPKAEIPTIVAGDES